MTVFDSFAAAGIAYEYDVTRLRRIAESYGRDTDDAVRDAMVLAQTTAITFTQAVDATIHRLGYERLGL